MNKVFHIVPPFQTIPLSKSSGINLVVQKIAEGTSDFENHIVCIRHPEYVDDEYRNGVYYHRVYISAIYKRVFQKWTRWDPNSYVKRVARIINKYKPQILHFHNKPMVMGGVVKLLTYKPKILYEVHNESSDPIPHCFDCLVGCSKFIMNNMAQRNNWHGMSRVIYNGVDLNRFHATIDTQPKVFQNHNLENKFVILCIAHISEIKNPLFLVETIVQKLSNFSQIRLLIAGQIRRDKNPNEDRTKYARKVIEASDERIILLDHVDYQDMPRLLNMCDLYIQPSKSEAMCLSVFEAMATKKPVIVTRAGGLPESVGLNQEGGIIVDLDNKQELANAIKSFIEDKSFLQAQAEKAYNRVVDFSWQRTVSEAQALYTEILQ